MKHVSLWQTLEIFLLRLRQARPCFLDIRSNRLWELQGVFAFVTSTTLSAGAFGTILGQYEIRSPLGAGGMGEVYRAHDTRLSLRIGSGTCDDDHPGVLNHS